ncbi:MAG: Hydrolase, TatD family, partial [Candidatus Azambacteria bacterium GW2011_GWE2_46_45]
MPKLIDTHTHVNFSAFKEDGKEVIERALKAGVWLINVGSQYSTSERAIRMAQNYEEGVYAAVGLHPIHLLEGHYDSSELDELVKFKTKAEEFDFEKY